MPVPAKSRRSERLPLPVTIFLCILIIVSFILYYTSRWYVYSFGSTGFDSIIFTLTSGISGTSSEMLELYMGELFRALFFGISACIVLFWRPRRPLVFRKLQLYPFPRWLSCFFAIGGSAILLIDSMSYTGFFVYVHDQLYPSSMYDREYVDPSSVQITFPEEKRNLVYIMLESMETTYLSEELGGASDVNLIPELYDLAKDNINFSHTEGVGGFHATNGTSWTIAAMVSQTAGIPLKTPSGNQNDYGQSGELFLPGATTITSILEDAGYYTTLMVGSDANFGGRKPYFVQHGLDKCYDIYTARRDGIVPSDYFVWWGMEDLHLFEYAKQELTEISQGDEPFAFTMLTVDTHHIGGYQCASCQGEYEETYEQSISCSSRQVLEFVKWLQAQPFYENTTVIITGDHLSMDNGYFERNVDGDFQRMVYHCILNSPVQTEHTKNREYCGVDLFPTTLAALGCTIEGDRLGLGVNLFSNLPTLSERWGFEKFNSELAKASDYYVSNFHTVPEA